MTKKGKRKLKTLVHSDKVIKTNIKQYNLIAFCFHGKISNVFKTKFLEHNDIIPSLGTGCIVYNDLLF